MDENSKEDLVLYEKRGGVCIMTLNRAEAYNALNPALVESLVDSINRANEDAEIRAIVFTGKGKAFCAGVDLKALVDNGQVLNDDTALMSAFRNLKKPLIGAINGYAMTGGLELALKCDVMYASENAVFADTHAKVGVMPTWGMSQQLPRLIGVGRAKEMSLSARKVDAQTALEWGLVNRVFPADQVLAEAIKLATEIAGNNQTVVSGLKDLIETGAGMPLNEALLYENKTSHQHNDHLDFSGMLEKLNELRKKK